MSRTIHGLSHQALKYLRDKPAALAVFWDYVSRANYEGIAWPSVAGLSRDTGWSHRTCFEARKWLVECGALERIENYVRPDWRDKKPQDKQRYINFDHAEYYRPTGRLTINSNTYSLLYIGDNEQGDETNPISDVIPGATSTGVYIGADSTELDSNEEELGSRETITARETAPSDQPEKPKRQRSENQRRLDAMVDAMVLAFGLVRETVTKKKWAEFRGASSELLEARATPEDIPGIYAECVKRGWQNFSAYGLSKAWPDYCRDRQRAQARDLHISGPSAATRAEAAMYGTGADTPQETGS